MTGRRRDSALLTAGAVCLALTLAPPSHAIDDCGVGMYFNNAAGQCEPWAPVGVDFAPAVDVPVPVPVPLGIGFDPLPVGIGFDPDFGWNIPNVAPFLRGPNWGVPGIPGVHVPGVDLRGPDLRGPDLRVPDVRVPDVRIPEVHGPEVHIGRR